MNHALIERDGVIPAPYRARLHRVALMRWSAVRDSELKELLRNAVALTFAKLPKRTREFLSKNQKPTSVKKVRHKV